MTAIFGVTLVLCSFPLMFSQELSAHLGDVIESLIHSGRIHYSGPSSKSAEVNAKKFESDGLFAIEIEAADRDHVLSLAETAGFEIEKKLQSFENIYVAKHRNRRKRDTEDVIGELLSSGSVRWAEPLIPLYREKRVVFSDPNFDDQLSSWSTLPGMFIPDTWHAGLSGRGVNVAVLDDGIDFRHEDLRGSYDSEISYNFVDKGGDIAPRTGSDETHGTRCAGIIAMTANNSKCGVGVAFRAKLGGLKVLNESQTLNDAVEGDSLAFKSERIDIYSVSWGPRDDGRTAERPGSLAQKALEYGTMHGRHGLGSLYVWASGNGGLEDDDCAMDGYASNLHTITLGVVNSSASPPWYAEGCGAVLASVTEGAKTTRGMVTTDVGDKCVYFAGTSAAAPLGAAVLALALEANPGLSQRDVQHLIVRTSERDSLVKTSPQYWVNNGAGLPFSRYFGFGVLNALKLTEAAKQWKRIEPMSSCAREITVTDGIFAPGSPLFLKLPFHGCKGTSGEVNHLERLQVVVTIEHPRRGLISLTLTSPSGTTIQLLHPRKNDDSSEGLNEWPFVSVGYWSENPQGTWKLEAASVSHNKDAKAAGVLKFVKITAHGTRSDPLKDNDFIINSNTIL